MTTPREIDAKLAEAIGCKPVWEKWNSTAVEAWHCECMADGYPHGDYRHQSEIQTYYSAPTWETSGQLIDWFKAAPANGLQADPRARRFDEYLSGQFWPSGLTPQRIADAARLAFGIEES